MVIILNQQIKLRESDCLLIITFLSVVQHYIPELTL